MLHLPRRDFSLVCCWNGMNYTHWQHRHRHQLTCSHFAIPTRDDVADWTGSVMINTLFAYAKCGFNSIRMRTCPDAPFSWMFNDNSYPTIATNAARSPHRSVPLVFGVLPKWIALGEYDLRFIIMIITIISRPKISTFTHAEVNIHY